MNSHVSIITSNNYSSIFFIYLELWGGNDKAVDKGKKNGLVFCCFGLRGSEPLDVAAGYDTPHFGKYPMRHELPNLVRHAEPASNA